MVRFRTDQDDSFKATQGESRTPLSDWQREAKAGIAKDTATLTVKCLRGEITREQYLAGLRDLDQEYPHHTLRGERTSHAPNNFAEAADMLEYAAQRDAARRYAEEVTEWRR